MTLYDRIILLCDSKGVKGGRMCTEIGISKSTLTDLKMGRKTGLSAKNAQKIASYLGVSVGYLLGEENNEEITVSVSREIFSKNLRFLMAKTNKSRNEVSEDIGVSYFTFSDWCNGKKYPRVEKIELLAKYFGVTVSELVSDQKNDTKPKEREQNDKKEVLDIILRLHNDSDFLQVVEKLSELNETQLVSIKQFLETFIK